MLAARANRHRAIFYDVPDPETITGRGAEAEVAERRVAAVGGAEDGVVDFVPSGVGEDGGEAVLLLVAHGALADATVFTQKTISVGGRDLRRVAVAGGAVVAVCAGALAVSASTLGSGEGCFRLALPQPHQGVQVAIVTFGFRALLGDVDVLLARLAEGVDFGLGGVVCPEGADEVDAFHCDGSDGFCAAVEE